MLIEGKVLSEVIDVDLNAEFGSMCGDFPSPDILK